MSYINDLQGDLANALEDLEEAQAQLAECRAVLREVEWAEGRDHGRDGSCTLCTRDEDAGHAPDCRLKKALGEGL